MPRAPMVKYGFCLGTSEQAQGADMAKGPGAGRSHGQSGGGLEHSPGPGPTLLTQPRDTALSHR